MGRTGYANLPLHGGHCPPWLFARMVRLAAAILETIVVDYGPREALRRLSDPFWFQAFGGVLGFDWHSSGLTTVVCGAIKEGMEERQGALGLFFAGGKGRASRRTPDEIRQAGARWGLPASCETLVQASRLAAKVDNAALQDGFQIYHHFFIFTAEGQWAVVQQGLNEASRYARRYHWLSDGEAVDFSCEPHSAVCGEPAPGPVWNLVARESDAVRSASLELLRHPREVLDALPHLHLPGEHAVPQARRLDRVLYRLYERPPGDYTALLGTEGVGAATLRALAMVAEVTHGARASFRDPVRYSFAHGGKDGHPFPVQREVYDRSLAVLEESLRRARLGDWEKDRALRRLAGLVP